jgi:Protein of unknown function (DUF1552)
MTRRMFSRRSLIRGAGASLLALPFLNNIPSAEAQSFPTRFVVFFSGNEPIGQEHWEPGTNMALTDVMSPLEPHKDKLNILGKVRMESRLDDDHPGGHVGIAHLLIGRQVIPFGPNEGDQFAGGKSLDMFLGEQLGETPMIVGAKPGGNSGNSRLSYTGPNEPVHPEDDPLDAFDKYLGTATLNPQELANLHAQRQSILDQIAGHIDGVKPKLSQADREKLEIHLDRVRDLELKLQQTTPASCEPTAPVGGFDKNSNADFPEVSRMQMDLVTQALSCGVSRLATIQLGNSGAGGITPNWGGGEGIDINTSAHNICHDYNTNQADSGVQSRRQQLETWWYKQFAYFLDQLDSVQEGDGTLLDNTLVLWMKPIGYNHNVSNMMFMTAGGAGGQLQTGRYIDAGDQPHNNLLVSCANMMGVDINSYGDAAYCTGAMNGLV